MREALGLTDGRRYRALPVGRPDEPAMQRIVKAILVTLLALFVLPTLAFAALWLAQERPASWRAADWSSAGLLPAPAEAQEASIHILAARTGGLKGIVSVHSWIVLKRAGAQTYERYDVVGWGRPVRLNHRPADGRWYSNEPVVVYQAAGEAAERLFPKVEAAIGAYPWQAAGSYRSWPGPNSNTFVAWVLAEVPEIEARMPPTAVGRDFPLGGTWLRRLPAGGVALSLGGIAGLTIGPRAGLEVNFFGLVAGVSLAEPGLIVPAFGLMALPL
jgi:hypothetical protein